MKTRLTICLLFALSFAFLTGLSYTTKRAGFYMPDSLREVSIRFKNYHNLIILPVTINDTLHVNLILDTGCRNLILFGKSFQKYFSINPNNKVQFSGLGEGKALNGGLAIDNKVSIGAVLGESIPLVVIRERGVFNGIENVDGVIGYDIFIKFEIELNPRLNMITFRPAMVAFPPEGYTKIPVQIQDSRPVLRASIEFNKKKEACDLMIDTGSSLGLLLKTTDVQKFSANGIHHVIGRGFNGIIEGFETIADKISLPGLEIRSLAASITASPWHNHASVGMQVLKDYAVVLNYCKEYICLKKL